MYILHFWALDGSDIVFIATGLYIKSSHFVGSSNQNQNRINITSNQVHVTRGNVNETQVSKKSREGGDIENCNFKLVSQNVKGLKTDKVKRETVFNYLKENGDIALLQETHSTIDAEDIWKNECRTNFLKVQI